MSVYTSLEAADIARFLKLHTQGDLVAFAGIAAGIENTNYFVTTTAEDSSEAHSEFVLTLFETTAAENLDAYFNLMANLAAHQLPAAEPVRNRYGSFLCELKTKPAVLIKRLPGQSVGKPSESHCALVGGFLANMHLAPNNQSIEIENFRGASWRKSIIEKLHRCCDKDEIKFLNDSHTRMCNFEQANLPKGNVHGDLFHDNALFVNDTLTGVIDFYYAHHAAFIYDLAVTVADWCFVQNNGEIHRSNALATISGYTGVRPLSSLEIERWPAAMELASLRFLLSRLHDKHFPREGSLTQEKDPEVFKQLLTICQEDPHTLRALIAPNRN